MQDQRVKKRPLLHFEDPRQRDRFQAIRRETVHSFCRQTDHLPLTQQPRGPENIFRRGRRDVIRLPACARLGFYLPLWYGTV